MKLSLFLLFAFSCYTTTLFSQYEWVGDIGFSSGVEQLQKTKSKQYLLTGYTSRVGMRGRPSITLMDSTGNYLSTTDLYLGGLEETIELPDSTFLLYGWWGCDWLTVEFRKFDKNWNPDPTFQVPDGSWNSAIALSNGDIMFSGWQDKLKKIDRNGNVLWERDGNFDDYNDYILLSGDSIFFTFENGLVLMDSSGNQLNTFTNLGFSEIEINSQGNYLGSTHDTLYLLSPSFEVLATAALPVGDYMLDFSLDGGMVAILTGLQHVYFFDENLNPTSGFQTNAPCFFYQILLENDGVMLSGNVQYGGPEWEHSNSQPVLKKFAYDGGTATATNDIGVIAVSQPSEIVFTPMQYNIYTLTYKNINATVQNFGTSTVNKLDLNANFGDFGLSWEDCLLVYQQFNRHFENISLEPGETLDLNFGDLIAWHRTDPSFITDEEICLWTSSPDQKMETDRTNDGFCTSVLTSTNEPNSKSVELNIWPNPAQNTISLTVSNLFNASQWQLLDLNGKIQKHAFLAIDQSNIQVSVSDLPNGIYLWKMLNQNGQVSSGKLIVVH